MLSGMPVHLVRLAELVSQALQEKAPKVEGHVESCLIDCNGVEDGDLSHVTSFLIEDIEMRVEGHTVIFRSRKS